MNKFFENKDGIYFKNIFINESDIYVSEKDLGEKDFLEKFKTVKKGFVESRLKIPIESITQFIANEKERLIMLHFPKIDDDTTAFLHFKSEDEYSEVKEFLIAKTSFKGVKEFVGSGAWIKSALYTLAAAILTGACYMVSISDQDITIKGRRKGLKMLLAYLTDILGTTGVLIVGGIITLGLAYWTYTNFKVKGTEVEAYR